VSSLSFEKGKTWLRRKFAPRCSQHGNE